MYRMILERINFEDVINPQFAFPIVGVLLCALLVFAFGFKTPAQPPSFDFVEEHRKATKKKQKKGEKQQTKLVQNGAVQNQARVPSNDSNEKTESKVAAKGGKDAKQDKQHAQPTKVIPTKNVPSKALPTKAQNVKGQPAKAEGKNKNKKAAKTETEETPQPSPEEKEIMAGGEWAQIISRKERKNRKKDENVSTEVEKLLNNKDASKEGKKKKKKGTLEASPTVRETPKVNEPQVQAKEIEVKPEPTVEVETKAKESTEKIVSSEVEKPLNIKEASKEGKKNKKKGSPEASSAVQETPKLEPQVQPKEIETKHVVAAKPEPAGEPKKKANKSEKKENSPEKKAQKENAKAETPTKVPAIKTPEKAPKPSESQQKSRPVEDKLVKEAESAKTAANDDPKSDKKDGEEVSNKDSSNVVFDELGDMWQDAKPQKKKKKARKE